MIASKTFLGTLTALGLVGALGCSSNTTPEDKVRFLSDTDGDGMFSTPECDDPSAPEGACVIIPGPVDCDYIIFTSTWTVIADAAGNIVSEGWQDCIQCADATFTPVGVAECSGGTVDPIVCEALDDVLPGSSDPGMSGGGSSGEERADAPYGGGGISFPTSTCWWCHTTDGATSYVECVEPPPPACVSDEECGPGYHCEFWAPPCDSPEGYCPTYLVASGQCVPDYEPTCYTDDECGPGYYCEYGYGYPDPVPPTDPSMPADGGGSSGSGGSGGAPADEAPIAPPGGTCQPRPVTDFCYSDDDCRAFGPDWTCAFDTWTCPDGYACPAAGGEGDAPAGIPAVVSGTCQPPIPYPVDPCADLKGSSECLAVPGCNWAEYDIPCGTDALCLGFCYGEGIMDGGGAPR